MIYGAILTDRNKVGPSTIKESMRTVKKGKILGVFPEGGITSPVLTEAKPGAVYLASMAKAKILPVSVRGASNAWENIFPTLSAIDLNASSTIAPVSLTSLFMSFGSFIKD